MAIVILILLIYLVSILILVSSLSELIREGRGIIAISSWGCTVFARGAGSYSIVLKARYLYYRAILRLGAGKAIRL